jgi:hypothetical protein
MPIVNAYKHVFPVIGGEKSEDGQAIVTTEVYGTAFSIGGKYWITAGHVLRSAATHPIIGLGFVSGKNGKKWMTRQCGQWEVLESHDVGLFEADGVEATTLKWLGGELSMATPVFSVGFPYALNRDLMSINLRAFGAT